MVEHHGRRICQLGTEEFTLADAFRYRLLWY